MLQNKLDGKNEPKHTSAHLHASNSNPVLQWWIKRLESNGWSKKRMNDMEEISNNPTSPEKY